MSRRPATFTKADLSRAMAVARDNGMTVEVAPDGTIRLVPVTHVTPDHGLAARVVESF